MDTSTMTDELYRIELSLQLSMESLADMLIYKSSYDDDFVSIEYRRIKASFVKCAELKNVIAGLKRSIQ